MGPETGVAEAPGLCACSRRMSPSKLLWQAQDLLWGTHWLEEGLRSTQLGSGPGHAGPRVLPGHADRQQKSRGGTDVCPGAVPLSRRAESLGLHKLASALPGNKDTWLGRGGATELCSLLGGLCAKPRSDERAVDQLSEGTWAENLPGRHLGSEMVTERHLSKLTEHS